MVKDKETAESEKELGNQAFASKNYEKALEHFSNAISADPKKSEYYILRSETLMMMGMAEELKATNDALMSCKLNPKSWKCYLCLTKAYLQFDRLIEADESCRKGLKVCKDDEQGIKALKKLLAECEKQIANRKMKEDNVAQFIMDSRLRDLDEKVLTEWKNMAPSQAINKAKELFDSVLNKLKKSTKESGNEIRSECKILNDVVCDQNILKVICKQLDISKILEQYLKLSETLSDEHWIEILIILGNFILAGVGITNINIALPLPKFDQLINESITTNKHALSQHAIRALRIIFGEKTLQTLKKFTAYKFGPFFNSFATILHDDSIDLSLKKVTVRNLNAILSPLVNKDREFVTGVALKLEAIIPKLVEMIEFYNANNQKESEDAYNCLNIINFFTFHHPGVYKHGIMKASVIYIDPSCPRQFKEYALTIISYSTVNKTGSFRLKMEQDYHYQAKLLPLLKNYRFESISVLQGAMECLLRAYCYKSFHQFLTKDYCKKVTQLMVEIMEYMTSGSEQFETSPLNASFLVYCTSVVRYFHAFDGVSFRTMYESSFEGMRLFFNILKGMMKYYKHGIQSQTNLIEGILYANPHIIDDEDQLQEIEDHMEWCGSVTSYNFERYLGVLAGIVFRLPLPDLTTYELKPDDFIVPNGTDIPPDTMCHFCRKRSTKTCSRCGFARYCSEECQKSDWVIHKLVCSKK